MIERDETRLEGGLKTGQEDTADIEGEQGSGIVQKRCILAKDPKKDVGEEAYNELHTDDPDRCVTNDDADIFPHAIHKPGTEVIAGDCLSSEGETCHRQDKKLCDAAEDDHGSERQVAAFSL